MTIETVGGLLVVLVITWAFTVVLLLRMLSTQLKTKLLLETLVEYILRVDAVWHYGEELKKTDVYMVLEKLLAYSKEK